MKWNEAQTTHFTVRYENNWAPRGLTFDIERIHRALGVELGALGAWTRKEKVTLYVHKDKASFLKSPYKPPQWSNGFAIADERVLVLFEMKDYDEFQRIAAHELTHLFVNAFFNEEKARAPVWLNEGLAMYMEDRAGPKSARDGWWEASRRMPRAKVKPAAEFAETRPGADGKVEEVQDWYQQAFLMTRFLLTEHPRMKLRSFCAALREGKELPSALKTVYGYATPEKMDKAWTAYAGVRDLGAPEAKPYGKLGTLKPIEFLDLMRSSGAVARPGEKKP